ncbi:MAG: mRNA interferase RelE/StbE [Pyrinomonadaceae bacterium]|jgi:mRNA interferase RelE/StbE|nr:mRNA interferase RelE/StbE [Pyrinomonadaceae bacterium]
MTYEILIRRRASKQLADLPLKDYERVKRSIATLADNPRPKGCLKLTGRAGWRIRVGDYRVIYEVDDPNRTVTVLDIGNRRDIYN